jgi:hypothetical protein
VKAAVRSAVLAAASTVALYGLMLALEKLMDRLREGR